MSSTENAGNTSDATRPPARRAAHGRCDATYRAADRRESTTRAAQSTRIARVADRVAGR